MSNFDHEMLHLNYDSVLADPTFSAVVKQVLISLRRQPYMTLGDFFDNLTNTDLTALNFTIELAFNYEEPQALNDLIVIVHALSSAEGIFAIDDQEITNNINYFATLVTCETLARKGIVKVFHKNFSFGQDMRDQTIVEKID